MKAYLYNNQPNISIPKRQMTNTDGFKSAQHSKMVAKQ